MKAVWGEPPDRTPRQPRRAVPSPMWMHAQQQQRAGGGKKARNENRCALLAALAAYIYV